jgi:hypothetical protein
MCVCVCERESKYIKKKLNQEHSSDRLFSHQITFLFKENLKTN